MLCDLLLLKDSRLYLQVDGDRLGSMRKTHSTSQADHSKRPRDIARLDEIPNVGKATIADLRQLNIEKPSELLGQDPYRLYKELCRITGRQHDPCVIDIFIAAIRFMEGCPAKAWWNFTEERKRMLASQKPEQK